MGRVARAMATSFVRAYTFASHERLTARRDWFTDDGLVHEPRVNSAAQAGFVAGVSSASTRHNTRSGVTDLLSPGMTISVPSGNATVPATCRGAPRSALLTVRAAAAAAPVLEVRGKQPPETAEQSIALAYCDLSSVSSVAAVTRSPVEGRQRSTGWGRPCRLQKVTPRVGTLALVDGARNGCPGVP